MAFNYNGTSDYVEATLALSYPFTVACWFRVPDVLSTYTLIAAGNLSGADNDRIVLLAAGTVAGDPVICQAVTDGGATTNATSTAGYTANVWYHATMVCGSSTARTVYINGGNTGSSATDRAMTGLNVLTHGARRSGGTLGTFLSGDLAECAAWNVTLTPADVAMLAREFTPPSVRPQSLISYLPFVRNMVELRQNLSLASSGTTVVNHPRVYS